MIVEPSVFERMTSLGDSARSRLLLLLEEGEFTVSELIAVLQLPQSTVSRHLKVLADDGWVVSRADGTSRHYRMTSGLDATARELWGLVRDEVRHAPIGEEDAERAKAVLGRRRDRSREFFATAAGRWDTLRGELFGAEAEVLPLFGLLDSEWTVGDLGAGTGLLTEAIAPFVAKVVAVDASVEMLAAAKDRVADLCNVDLRQGELERLPVADSELDVAMLLLVLHYIVDPPSVLAEACRALCPGGRLVIVDMRAHARDGYREEMGHLWPGFTESQLEEWMMSAGLEEFRYRPLPPRPDAEGPLLFLATARRCA